ncbi:MAG: S8 family peptidase, partial [Actinomycetota bacterium]
LVLALTLGPSVGAVPARPAEARSDRSVEIIVRAVPGRQAAVARLVRSLGGEIERRLDILNGFSARVPARSVATLRSAPAVAAVTPNGSVTLQSHNSVDPGTGLGTSFDTTNAIGARKLWEQGYTGRGIDVALIDSGVAPVDGLSGSDKVVHGQDFSFESQAENLRYNDTFGHGTHMAGIIAGRESSASFPYHTDTHNYLGVAPDARLISVKVADAEGDTDVTQVIAAIEWVTEHRRDAGMNIRVLNLSFGTDGTQSYVLDPLSYAAERAWKKGIVVVVAAGNTGYGDSSLNNPAYNPFVIAVGADDTKGTATPYDDTVPEWSTAGNYLRNPDVVAPGQSVVSLRDPGSNADLNYPGGRVGERYFKGSGTSQAAAVTSGAVALLLDHRPSLSPDEVKYALTETANRLPYASSRAQGDGLIDLPAAKNYSRFWFARQRHVPATGGGTLRGARGSHILETAGEQLLDELDIFGERWGSSDGGGGGGGLIGGLLGGVVNGLLGGLLSGDGLLGGLVKTVGFITDPVLGLVTQTVEWNDNDWSGEEWTRNQWSRNQWSRNQWSGEEWSRNQWSRNQWSRNQWSGNEWSSVSWGQ